MPQPKYLFIDKQRVPIDPSRHVGTGGEAEVYKFGDGNFVVKVYKLPDHPDYAGNHHEQSGAEARIKTHQTKLPAFPKNRIPDGLTAPSTLAYVDKEQRTVAGYVMPFIHKHEELISFSQHSYKNQHAITQDFLTRVLQNLANLMHNTHDSGIVIGDFNWNNVLVGQDASTVLIDCDSMQWGSFLCQTFTEKFVDPLVCDPSKPRPFQVKPHCVTTDVYALYVIAFNLLMGIDPFGGICQNVKQTERALRGISVFHHGVNLPNKKSILPLASLPDSVRGVFVDVFERGRRDLRFDMNVLDLVWQRCSCGRDFAGSACPCGKAGKVHVVQAVQHRGKVSFQMIIDGRSIVHANISRGKLTYVYDDGEGNFRREDGTKVWSTSNRNVRFRTFGNETIVGDGNTLHQIVRNTCLHVGSFQGRLTMFDTNDTHLFYERQGNLCRQEFQGHIEQEVVIGQVLSDQTLFWVGETMGFGFYRVNGVQVSFVFNPSKRGVNDSISLPRFSGRILDSTVVFAKERCWFLVSVDDGKKVVNHCTCINRTGEVLGHAQHEANDGSWLGSLRGKVAYGDFLLAATDDGIIRVKSNGKTIEEEKRFLDTEAYVDSDAHLLPGPGGIYVISTNKVGLLKMQ